MWSASTSVALLGAFGLFLLSTANLTKKYQYFATLDELGSYKLYWSVDRTDESISFAVEVRTTGWVGFGISTGNGKMKGSDLVIGWVKDCKGYLTDRYAEDYSVPVLDKRQDYELTGFSENDGTTILKFKRKLNTCDDQDRKIQEGTSKLVFAYHPHDPHSPMDLLQHSVRGQRSVMLLNSLPGSMPTDAKHFDLRVDKVKVPESDTTYWCEAVKLPKFDKKYHIVKVKPLVQRGHEGLVHHIVMFNCKSTFNESAVFFRGPCEHPNMPNDYKDCQLEDLSVAWAVGSEGFTFPNEAGMPIGGEDGTRFMMFEVHYDNPLKKAGFVDSSGIRFFYTEPRKYDAGTLYTGRYSSEAGMIIPPKQKNWVATGYCSKHCTTLGLADTGLPQGGIKVFAVLLHAHLTGRKLKTKLIREGKEVQTIAQDDNFDFNFQETQYLPKEVRLFPGDELITECVYDTMERTNQTLGGLSTRDEMCLSFLWYYPLSNLVGCTAQDADVPVKIRKEFVHNNATKWPLIWNTTIVDKLRKLYDQPPNVTSKCPSSIPKRLPLWLKVPKPIITSPLPKPNLTCVASAKNTTTYLDPGAVYCKSRTGRLGTNYVTVVLGIWFIVAAMSVLQMR